MTDRRVDYIVTQKPGRSDWVAIFPAADKVETFVFGSIQEIEDAILMRMEEVYPGQSIELAQTEVPFDDFFGSPSEPSA